MENLDLILMFIQKIFAPLALFLFGYAVKKVDRLTDEIHLLNKNMATAFEKLSNQEKITESLEGRVTYLERKK